MAPNKRLAMRVAGSFRRSLRWHASRATTKGSKISRSLRSSRSSVPTLRTFGDSNAVGYRRRPQGTRGYLVKLLRKSFRVASTCGCAKLTILPSKFNFLVWLRKRLEITTLDETDYAVLFLGTNDIAGLKTLSMPWSDDEPAGAITRRVRQRLHTLLRRIRKYTRRTIFVVEPLNQMPRKRCLGDKVLAAMEAEVREFRDISWLSMNWADNDLQVSPDVKGRGGMDPRHLNSAAMRRLAQVVEQRVHSRKGDVTA
eukprot:TRINITY_DN55417_c0_g1_i1.p1 TRINITY_DN55417_c0_g1~~TRINITY_DN55417_c0_g1_i1.p1  ORF type:complete len:255 (-),score=17.89 TRINITY_DN55417_c0_g1_i1:100-864(-)